MNTSLKGILARRFGSFRVCYVMESDVKVSMLIVITGATGCEEELPYGRLQ